MLFLHFSILLCVVYLVHAQELSRIVGGSEASPEFGRFHASLQNLDGQHVCGGAIISKWHVVTAAHCLYGAEPEYIKVIVGTTNLSNGGMKYDVDDFKIYEQFNFSSRINDIAILRIKTQFDLNLVHIIKIYEANVQEDDIVFLSGFGANMTHGDSVNHMHVLIKPVFSQETCRYAMRYTREVTDSMFCTFSKIGQGTCNGDSGSPIIMDDKLVGVVSWGIPCATGFPDVHTRVAPFVRWLREQIKHDYCDVISAN